MGSLGCSMDSLGRLLDGSLGLLLDGQLGQLDGLLDGLLGRQPRDGIHLGPDLGQCLTQGLALPHHGGHNVRLLYRLQELVLPRAGDVGHEPLHHGLNELVHLGAVLVPLRQ